MKTTAERWAARQAEVLAADASGDQERIEDARDVAASCAVRLIAELEAASLDASEVRARAAELGLDLGMGQRIVDAAARFDARGSEVVS